ncbi:MAG: HlyD family efflux transporter periplasmic adaptor subunit [Actinomycetota bacterium]|nr:HlyD family efflux transporter periplasmic adaptor subunit [Actinomycetota bacterium]
MQSPLFRKEAMDQLSSPDELDRLMHVTDRRGWLALVALSAIVVAVVVWGFFGSIPIEVRGGDGALVRPGSAREVVALDSGVITEVFAGVGDSVRVDQAIARVRSGEGSEAEVVSFFDGTIAELTVREGMFVDRGSEVAILETGDEPLRAVVFVPIDDAERLEKGMRVHVSPSTAQAEEFGYMRGKVSGVSELPPSESEVALLMEDEVLARSLEAEGPQLEVTVELARDPATPSGFAWSSAKGPPFPITDHTPCTATFVLGEERPASLVLPSVR